MNDIDLSAVDRGDGLTSRPATFADASTVLHLIRTCEEHDTGEPMLEEAELVGDWQRPSFDLATDSVCVYDGDRLVAYAEIFQGRRAYGFVLPGERGRGIGTALLRWTWAVCRARGGTRVGQTVPEASDAPALLKQHGYTERYTSWILELPAGAEIASIELPAGFSVRAYRPGEEREIFQVIEDAFNEWPDREQSAYEDWAASVLDRPDFAPWHLLVAVQSSGADETIVGACHVDDEGWINTVAVRQDRRGLGLGRALLCQAFAEARQRGATESGLSTDSRTGVLGLYLHVGMQVSQTFVHYARQIGAEEPALAR